MDATLDLVDLDAVDAFAARAHHGQSRNTGDNTAPDVPYIVHPRAVRAILEREHPDAAVRAPWILATALLHDVLEDCDVDHTELSRLFGGEVSAAVRALSKQLKTVPAATKTDSQYWTVLAQSPLPIRQVKGADRIDNLRSCRKWRRDKLAQKYLRETPREVLPMLTDDPFLYATICDELAALARTYGVLQIS